MPEYDITREAAEDVMQIWHYYSNRANADLADERVDRMKSTICRTIVRFPASGRARPEFAANVRSYPVLPYVVFYRVQARHVLIVRILHGKRDIRHPLMSLLLAG